MVVVVILVVMVVVGCFAERSGMITVMRGKVKEGERMRWREAISGGWGACASRGEKGIGEGQARETSATEATTRTALGSKRSGHGPRVRTL
eukprot:4765373-Pleurochrysis_carterae.AAC.1